MYSTASLDDTFVFISFVRNIEYEELNARNSSQFAPVKRERDDLALQVPTCSTSERKDDLYSHSRVGSCALVLVNR